MTSIVHELRNKIVVEQHGQLRSYLRDPSSSSCSKAKSLTADFKDVSKTLLQLFYTCEDDSTNIQGTLDDLSDSVIYMGTEIDDSVIYVSGATPKMEPKIEVKEEGKINIIFLPT